MMVPIVYCRSGSDNERLDWDTHTHHKADSLSIGYTLQWTDFYFLGNIIICTEQDSLIVLKENTIICSLVHSSTVYLIFFYLFIYFLLLLSRHFSSERKLKQQTKKEAFVQKPNRYSHNIYLSLFHTQQLSFLCP